MIIMKFTILLERYLFFRSNQEAMLEKTMSVYRNAEESRLAMKVAMDTKEGQLHNAMQQIDVMQTLHERLVEQSRVLTGTV